MDGCAFFDCGPEKPGLAQKALMDVHRNWHNGGVYSLIWRYLNGKGLRQQAPEVLRTRMRQQFQFEEKVRHS